MKIYKEIINHIKNNKYDLLFGAFAGIIAYYLLKLNYNLSSIIPYSIVTESQGALNYVITNTQTLLEYKVLIFCIGLGIILADLFNIGNWFIKLIRRVK